MSKVQIADNQIVHAIINGEDSYNKTIKCTYFLIVLFSEGGGIHSIDGVDYPIKKQQLHFLFPGQHHHWETEFNTHAQKIIIGKKIFESFSSIEEFVFIRHNLNPVFKLSDTTYELVSKEIESLKSDIHTRQTDKHWDKILHLRIDILTSKIKREAENYIKHHLLEKSHPKVKNFWILVKQHYTEKKTLSWYAKELGISANYLNILCQKSLNITASEIMYQRIMQEAKKQIRCSEKSVKEITFDLGFNSISGFSAFFKKNSGFTPSEYKEYI